MNQINDQMILISNVVESKRHFSFVSMNIVNKNQGLHAVINHVNASKTTISVLVAKSFVYIN